MAGPFYFAWVAEGTNWGLALAREDEEIFAIEISQEEGGFPSLLIDVVNPRIGLLAAGRNIWAWLSWDNGTEIVPLFNGRLFGVPENLHGEVVRLQFIARPVDYQTAKAALAETLKERPYWDDIWISEGDDDPDTVLEARTQSWHIDRLTLALTVSDQLIGEDGTLVITADDHLYDDMEVSFGETPLRRALVTGTVTWTQTGAGTMDITQEMVDAFRAAGSPYYYPLISSFTPGLFDDWPAAETNIGGGWSIGVDATIEAATWAAAWLLPKVYLLPDYKKKNTLDEPGFWKWKGANLIFYPSDTHQADTIAGWETWATVFTLAPYSINLTLDWTAARPRTEIVTFTLVADIQSLLTDPGDAEELKIELTSNLLDQEIDPDDAMPIGDLRRNSYFNTDRGAQSFEYLLMLARAHLRLRARAVKVKCVTPWAVAVAAGVSCRQNAQIFDDRLPGGVVAGKITGYVLSATGEGPSKAEITIGCSVGYGGVGAFDEGTPTWADDYVNPGYQAMIGATINPGSDDLSYQSFDDLDVVDDDGLDLFRMTPDRMLNSITITGGPNHQAFTTLAIFAEYKNTEPLETPATWKPYVEKDDPTTVLTRDPTVVTIDLLPIGTQSFETTFAPAVSALSIPQTVDLEAPSNA